MRFAAVLIAVLGIPMLAGAQTAPPPQDDAAPAVNKRHIPPPTPAPEPEHPSPAPAPSGYSEPVAQPPARPPLNDADVAILTGAADHAQQQSVAPQVYMQDYGMFHSQFGYGQFGPQFGTSQFGTSQFVTGPAIFGAFGHGHPFRPNFILLGNTGFGAPVFIPLGGGPNMFVGFAPW